MNLHSNLRLCKVVPCGIIKPELRHNLTIALHLDDNLPANTYFNTFNNSREFS